MSGLPPRINFAGGTPAFDAWRDALRWTTGLAGAGALRARRGAAGPVLSLDGDVRRYVLLSGSSSPYTGTEVYGTPGGGWANLLGAPTLTGIYEDNALSGLGGKVVRVRPSRGEWRFTYKRRGGCKTRLQIQGCKDSSVGQNYQPLPGASVAVSLAGNPVASGTTDGNGYFEFPIAAAGNYGVSATAPRFLPLATSVGLGCNATASVRMLPDTANYVCTTLCPYPLKKTLFFTVPLWGSGVLTYDGTSLWICGRATYAYSGCGTVGPQCRATNAEAIFRFSTTGGFSIQYGAPLPPIDGSIWYKCPTQVITSQNSQSLGAIARGNLVCTPGSFAVEFIFQDRDVFCGTPHTAVVSE